MQHQVTSSYALLWYKMLLLFIYLNILWYILYYSWYSGELQAVRSGLDYRQRRFRLDTAVGPT
jgi:hypothetical protein